jgi:hypothetical protein
MNDNVVVKKTKSANEGMEAVALAFAWLNDHLGRYQYTRTLTLTGHISTISTIGKPKHITDFTKTVQIFKKSTGLKLGRIHRIGYWRNDNWTYYEVVTSDHIYHVVKFDDSMNALQFKLSVW